MPELPEVETLCRELTASVGGSSISGIHFFREDLREGIPTQALEQLCRPAAGVTAYVGSLERRSKYLLQHIHHAPNLPSSQSAETSYRGTMLIHLGMSGRLRLSSDIPQDFPHHTHWYMWGSRQQSGKWCVSYEDARRFGRLSIWQNTRERITEHPYLAVLGREPLEGSSAELAHYLYAKSRSRKRELKSWIMDAAVVVGVGNIYASEALFRAGLSPWRKASSLTESEAHSLAEAIQFTLELAIEQGGSTLKDFRSLRGKSGLFPLKAQVYGLQGKHCPRCAHGTILKAQQHQRSTYYCPLCQPA